MADHSRPTLTEPKGMGGIVAQDGFDYQVWDAIIRLPSWLRKPVFEGLIVEGLEDVEARFFAPHCARGYFLDRFQAKSGELTRREIEEVFRSFARFEAAYPEVARTQVLVTPGLPRDLQWLTRRPDRVRRARPFYAPFTDILAASDEKLEQDFIKQFGTELGPQVARSFEVEARSLPNRAAAEGMFGSALGGVFPNIDLGQRAIQRAFRLLADCISGARGQLMGRAELLGLLSESLDPTFAAALPLHVHFRSDRNAAEEDALEIDASGFSGTGERAPGIEQWRDLLLAPLDVAATWALKNPHSRVRITGSYRLSTAFAAGWSFRSAKGFELEIATRDGDWNTDDRPGPDDRLPLEIMAPRHLHEGRLIVSVGVLRNPAHDVKAARSLANDDAMLSIDLGQPITSGREAQAVAQTIKQAVDVAVARLAPGGIDLFVAGPTALALAIGHRWNAMRATQLHEFRAGEGYVPSAQLM